MKKENILVLLANTVFFLVEVYPDSQAIELNLKEFELHSCGYTELFKEEIFEAKTVESGTSYVKINTYLKCKCYHHYKMPAVLVKMREDPKNPNRKIYAYYCPGRPPKYLPKCTEFDICKKAYYNEYGIERRGESYVDHTNVYCACDLYQKCSISAENTKVITYQCKYQAKKKMYALPPCRENSFYMKEVYQVITEMEGMSDMVKLNSHFICECDRQQNDERKIRTRIDPNREDYWIVYYRCPESSKKAENKTCMEYDICKKDFYNKYGKENSNEIYLETTDEYCTCNFPRVCGTFIKESTVTIYRCIHPDEDKQEHICKENEVYMEETYKMFTSSKRKDVLNNLRKMNTFLKCMCNHRQINERPISIRLDYERLLWIFSYRCFKPLEKVLSKCSEHDICQPDYFNEFGDERPEEKYLASTDIYCKCDSPNVCSIYSEDSKSKTYRCIHLNTVEKKLPLCEENKVYMEETYQIRPTDVFQISRKFKTINRCICNRTQEDGSQTIVSINTPVQNTLVFGFLCSGSLPEEN